MPNIRIYITDYSDAVSQSFFLIPKQLAPSSLSTIYVNVEFTKKFCQIIFKYA